MSTPSAVAPITLVGIQTPKLWGEKEKRLTVEAPAWDWAGNHHDRSQSTARADPCALRSWRPVPSSRGYPLGVVAVAQMLAVELVVVASDSDPPFPSTLSLPGIRIQGEPYTSSGWGDKAIDIPRNVGGLIAVWSNIAGR